MNIWKTRNILSTLAITFSISVSASSLVDSLKELELQPNDLTTKQATVTEQKRRDISVILGLSQGLPPSQEGIPGNEAELDSTDLINSAYSTSTLIQKAIDMSRQLPMGQKIQNYRDSVARILQKSGQNPMEQAVRITLNRAVDTTNNIVAIAGLNSEVVAQLLANFYENSFKLALAYANNPSFILSTKNTEVADYIRKTSIAQFGYYFSTLMWRSQSNLTSESSKAVVLIKMLGYLGWDFNMDLRRREPGLKEIIADIYNIQNNDLSYKNIINSLAANQEPRSSDVSSLRVKVFKIWSVIPQKLSSAGISVSVN